jgi:hypothetical protein
LTSERKRKSPGRVCGPPAEAHRLFRRSGAFLEQRPSNRVTRLLAQVIELYGSRERSEDALSDVFREPSWRGALGILVLVPLRLEDLTDDREP